MDIRKLFRIFAGRMRGIRGLFGVSGISASRLGVSISCSGYSRVVWWISASRLGILGPSGRYLRAVSHNHSSRSFGQSACRLGGTAPSPIDHDLVLGVDAACLWQASCANRAVFVQVGAAYLRVPFDANCDFREWCHLFKDGCCLFRRAFPH